MTTAAGATVETGRGREIAIDEEVQTGTAETGRGRETGVGETDRGRETGGETGEETMIGGETKTAIGPGPATVVL